MVKHLLALAILFLCIGVSEKSIAQTPVADFSADKTAGCSPVVVQFTDKSTGSPTSWHWDLGNGGSSTLQNPAATYFTPGTYKVVLTVTNSNGSTKDTTYITVYAAPSVAFTADTTVTCGTKTVQFNNSSNSGGAATVSYLWDFGDGDTSTAVSPTHNYTYAGSFTVSLVAINSSGCTKTLTKANYIKVNTTPTAIFGANKTSGCGAPMNVTFFDSSINAASYAWDFGDGNSSSSANPSHSYTSSGTYTVRLIVTGSNGCKDTLTKISYIVIGQVVAGFTTSSPVCVGKATVFTNTTTPASGASRTWSFGNGATSTLQSPSYNYPTPGVYTVTLIEKYAANCIDTFSQSVTVNASPVADFMTPDTIGCKLPFTANFTNTSTGASSYAWKLGISNTPSTATNPVHTFINSYGGHSITLTATNAAGCQSIKLKEFYVQINLLKIALVSSHAGTCTDSNVKFTATVNNPQVVTNYKWDFGDVSPVVNCATCSVQNHSYSSGGTYTVKMVVSTSIGCSDSLTKIIKVGTKPTAAFSGTPLLICPNALVNFTNSSTGAISYMWNFGDGFTDTAASPGHSFSDADTFDVTLIAVNNGCNDTLLKEDYVKVQLPDAQFSPTYSCSNRQQFTFIDESIGADTYFWDFGDGSTSTTSGNVSHTYSTPGVYNAVLIVTNTGTGCADTIARVLKAQGITVPTFTANDTTICRGELLTITRTGTNEYTYAAYLGTMPNNGQAASLGWYTNTGGVFDVKIIVTDSLGCKDSVTKTNYVRVGGTTVNFTASDTTLCKGLTLLYDDNTVATGFPIASRFWVFGDGQQDFSVNDTITHLYNNAGPYDLKLVVTDSNGCKDSLLKSEYVYVYKPIAQFHTSDTVICAGDVVSFVNNSGGANFTANWQFGDGSTSTIVTPSHTYSALDTYTVKLVLTDEYGCKDSMVKVDYIKVDKPLTAFTLSDTFGACPPLTIQATNTTPGTNTYAWTFGNNNQASIMNPSITYTYPGVYTVNLIATNSIGCKDSISKTVKVNGPTGTYTYTPLIGCNPLTVNFSATSNNTSSYIWDMNNGVTQTTSSGSFSYTFTQTGRYVPRLILSDGASCLVPVQNTDTLTVDELEADFSFTTVGNLCNNDTVYFNDTILQSYSSIASRTWDFGDGTTSTAEDPSHFFNTPGTYHVKLIVENANGCTNTTNKTVIINTLPTVTINAPGDSLCPGQPAGIQLTATGALTYTWTPTSGLSCTGCPNPVANPQVKTTYIVTGTDANGCNDMDTFTIGIKAIPAVVISNDTSICAGASTGLTASGAVSYAWSPAAGLSCINCNNLIATPSSTSTYTVIGTNVSGCKDTTDVTVTVLTKPVVSANTNPTICMGDTVTLTATGATTYNWAPATALSCTGCSNPNAAPNTTTAYSVTGTLANGCKDTTQLTVNVNPQPVVSAGADKTICVGSSTTLQATGATNYTWSPAAGLSCTSCASPSANPVVTTTYTVIGVNGNGCKDTATVTVTVNPLPVVNAGADKIICAGLSTTLQATGAVTYTWSPVTGLSCVSCSNPTANPAATTSYIVTGTDANGCIDTGVVKVLVNTLPLVDAGADKNICPGDSVQIQVSGATSYSWSPTNGLSCTGCNNPKASPVVLTSYVVQGIDANGCKNTDTVKVIINSTPVVSAGSNTAICTGNNTTLQATGAATYIWTPATDLSCTGCDNPTATPAATTTYTVIGISGISCKDTATVTVTVNPLPIVSGGADKEICAGSSTALQATGATAYTWTPASGLSCTSCANPTATPSATTAYTVTGTDAKGCVDTGVVKVIINPLPVVSAGSNATICLKDSAQLQATGATTYMWSPAAGLSCTNCASPKASPSNTTVYVVTGTDAKGCKNTSTVTVNVNALPTVSAGTDKTICNGSSVSLAASGAVSYTWSPVTGLSCTNCATPAASPSATTTYIVTGTDANSCTNTAQVKVNVNALPNVNAGSNETICMKDSVELQVSGAVHYNWTPAPGLSCTNCPSPKSSPATTTTYTIKGTDANGCVNTSTVTVTVKQLPIVSAGNDVAICSGSKTQLTATGAVSYSWTPAMGLSCTGCANPVAAPAATTTYIVKGTAANSCIATDTINVAVNPLPTVSAGGNVTMCEQDSVNLQATGAVSYVWTPAASLSCSACPNPVAKPAATTKYDVIGTDANGCNDTAQVTITVNPIPILTTSVGRPLICGSDTTQLVANGATTYSWSPTTNLSCANCASPVANPPSTTTYLVTGTTKGCSDTVSVIVNTRIKPKVNAGPDTAYCQGEIGSLLATGAISYEWSPANGLSCAGCPNPEVIVNKTTVFTLTGTDADGCTNTDDVRVTIHKLPAVDAGEDQTVCDGKSVQLFAQGAVNYTWSPATGLSCTTCPAPFASTSSKATFIVTGIDVNGCSNSDAVVVTAITKEPVSHSSDDSICVGESTILFATGGTDYTWSPLAGLDGYRAANITAAPVVTTKYMVIIKQGDCFTDTGYTTISVFNLPEIDAGEDQELRGGNEIKLEPRSKNVTKYEWSPAENLSCIDCPNPVATPKRTTTYQVVGTSPQGCVAQDDVTVYVTCGTDQLFIANTFTPNNDGVNDIFFPQGKGLNVIQRFSVYSRWGELLYDAQNIPLNDPLYGWNGMYKSEPMKPDVFVYVIRAVCEDGNPIEIKGDISLVR